MTDWAWMLLVVGAGVGGVILGVTVEMARGWITLRADHDVRAEEEWEAWKLSVQAAEEGTNGDRDHVHCACVEHGG